MRRVSARTKQSYNFLKFAPMLAFVSLRLTPDVWEKEIDPKENIEKALVGLFKWLKDKGVEKIIKLVVREDPKRRCSEAAVKECISGFDIRYLDWDKPDMCAGTLKAAENCVELWLHSSGLNAVLCSWSDERGLGTLRKVLTRPYPSPLPSSYEIIRDDERLTLRLLS
jgi:hypothetical protein